MQAQNIVKPPSGKHSVKGLGKTHPDPAQTVVMADGVEIPLGKGIPSPHTNTSLLYNEYPFLIFFIISVTATSLVATFLVLVENSRLIMEIKGDETVLLP